MQSGIQTRCYRRTENKSSMLRIDAVNHIRRSAEEIMLWEFAYSYLSKSLKALPALNAGTLQDAIFIFAPV